MLILIRRGESVPPPAPPPPPELPPQQRVETPPTWRLNLEQPVEPLIDMSTPELWNEQTQHTVDRFRLNLQNCRLRICATCSRFQSFDQSSRTDECGHCATQRRKGNISHFSAANDMDPGDVSPFLRNTLDRDRFHRNLRASRPWRRC